jgi:hypothetical protein
MPTQDTTLIRHITQEVNHYLDQRQRFAMPLVEPDRSVVASHFTKSLVPVFVPINPLRLEVRRMRVAFLNAVIDYHLTRATWAHHSGKTALRKQHLLAVIEWIHKL